MSQQIILKPLGIITQPNKLGVIPPGSFSVAENAIMRDPGTVESASLWTSTTGSGFVSATDMCFVFQIGAFTLFITHNSTGTNPWRYRWLNVSTNTLAFGPIVFDVENGVDLLLDSAALWGAVTVRKRTLLLTTKSVAIWDFSPPTTTAQATNRTAGLMPPLLSSSATVTTNGGAIKDGQHCHVTGIFRRKYADGYEIVSQPSVAAHLVSSASPVNLSLIFRWLPNFNIVGDILEIYRTRSQVATFNGGTNTGSVYLLSTTYVLTATDISNGFATVLDTASDSSLGEGLYTNQGIGGGSAGARPPPSAKCIAQFRGHTFYGNYTNAAFFKFRIPTYWGSMEDAAAGSPPYIRKNAIGLRYVVGTTSIGSPTITGVSAADLVGIVVNQVAWGTLPFPIGTVVTAVGATTITMAANATAAGTTSILLTDRIEIAGISYNVDSIEAMVTGIGAPAQMIPSLLDRVWPEPDSLPAVLSNQVRTIPADWLVFDRLRFDTSGNPDAVTVRATNGYNYVPRFPRWELNETPATYSPTAVPNGLQWSENSQPENCPALNIDVAGKGEVYAFASTRDALWIFASDGLWRLSGTGGKVGFGYDWRIDPVDSTLSLSGPQAWCVHRDMVYAYTSRGLVRIDSSGSITELSQGRVGDVIPGPAWSTPTWSASTAMYLVANETTDEVWMREPLAATPRIWIYNTITDAFTQVLAFEAVNDMPMHGAYSSTLEGIVSASFNVASSGISFCLKQDAATFAGMTLRLQPVSSNNPFVQRHWQQLNVAMETSASPTLTASVNSFGNIGARTISGTNESEYARTSFSVPRNAPAVANNIAFGLSTTAGTGRVKVQGLEIHYEDQSDQRKKR